MGRPNGAKGDANHYGGRIERTTVEAPPNPDIIEAQGNLFNFTTGAAVPLTFDTEQTV